MIDYLRGVELIHERHQWTASVSITRRPQPGERVDSAGMATEVHIARGRSAGEAVEALVAQLSLDQRCSHCMATSHVDPDDADCDIFDRAGVS